jgi:3'-5' exonuclease
MTALVVFDVEAVPDFEMARRLLEQPDDTPDADIRRMLGGRYARNGEDPTTAFLKAPLYRDFRRPYFATSHFAECWSVF